MKIVFVVAGILLPMNASADSLWQVSSLGVEGAAQPRRYASGDSFEGSMVASGSSCETFHAMAVSCQDGSAPLWHNVAPGQGSCILRCNGAVGPSQSSHEGGSSSQASSTGGSRVISAR